MAPTLRLDSKDVIGPLCQRVNLNPLNKPTGAVASAQGGLGGLNSIIQPGLGPGGFCEGSVGPRPRFDEDVQLPLIKVVILGAPGVGKTSLVMRFVNNEFNEVHCLTSEKSEFFPSLILNGSLFELKLIDLPVISNFPTNSIAEWNNFRSYGLRSASAYLLVFDLSIPSTFNFVKHLRDQICESRDMTNVPVIIVANKVDLVASKNFALNVHQLESANQHEVIGGQTNLWHGFQGSCINSPDSLAHDLKEVSHMVKKTWRSSYVKCSAKYNWNVMAVFRELAVTLNMIANGQSIGGKNSSKKSGCFMF